MIFRLFKNTLEDEKPIIQDPFSFLGMGLIKPTVSALVPIGTQIDFDYDASMRNRSLMMRRISRSSFGLVSREEAKGRILRDEEAVLDRGRMRAVVLEEYVMSGPVFTG